MRDVWRPHIRTTLDIDDDVLAVGRELARHRQTTIGAVLSELARMGMRRSEPDEVNRNGIRTLPRRGLKTPITMELVNRLRDELP